MGLPLEAQLQRPVTCCFTGHRRLEPQVEAALPHQLDTLLETLYQQGFRRFYDGAALGLDLLAAEAVLRLRQQHPDVQLILALPCAEQTRTWPKSQKQRYSALCAAADRCELLSDHYYSGCMMVRNRHMVDRSALCVCYLSHMAGGTLATVRYATHQGLPVFNLALGELFPSDLAVLTGEPLQGEAP